MIILALLIVGYFLGCINSSIILTKAIEKKDVRNFGSGNAGFTNTLRNFKRSTAVLVFIGDALKAAVALTLALIIAPDKKLALFGAGIGVILGHNFPFQYNFKGGKGVLVSCVALFYTDWRIGLIVLIVSVLIMFITGYVSLGSLTGALIIAVLSIVFHRDNIYYVAFYLIVAGLGVYMHRANIKRLLNGTENCFRRKKNV